MKIFNNHYRIFILLAIITINLKLISSQECKSENLSKRVICYYAT